MKLTSANAFWALSNGLKTTYPSVNEDIETDVVIIGAGITGGFDAHQCVSDGHRVVILDKREVCHGSTSATTSLLQYEIDVPLFKLIEKVGEEHAIASYKACHRSIDIVEKLALDLSRDSGFKRKSSIYFCTKKGQLKALRKEFEVRKHYGFEVEWIMGNELQNEYGLKGALGAIRSAQGASVDAYTLAYDLLAASVEKGLIVRDNTEVTKVEHDQDAVKVITCDGHRLKAKKLIYCNGFESTEILGRSFVKLLSTYATVGEQLPGPETVLDDVLFWNMADPYIYARATDDGRMLIGGEDEEFVDPQKRDRRIQKKAEKLEKTMHELFPKMPYKVDFAWAGTFGETEDGCPFIGEHKDHPNTYWVLGFGGNGITFSTIGREMVSAYLSGQDHPMDEPWGFPGRFK
ncbi:MAG: FAD-binding oxidoreductase [Flavobacteriales bacterium]|nr:FAD-binding oxidoreductase [Flavobacteriales bacterium]